jgi:hypothetical protein
MYDTTIGQFGKGHGQTSGAVLKQSMILARVSRLDAAVCKDFEKLSVEDFEYLEEYRDELMKEAARMQELIDSGVLAPDFDPGWPYVDWIPFGRSLIPSCDDDCFKMNYENYEKELQLDDSYNMMSPNYRPF